MTDKPNEMPDFIYATKGNGQGITPCGTWSASPVRLTSGGKERSGGNKKERTKYFKTNKCETITLRNDGDKYLVVEVNGKEVIRDFYVSGECEINHTYHLPVETDTRADLVEKMREALEFYADMENWEYTVTSKDESFIRFAPASTREEAAQTAREAMKGNE
jgi:hypothetical protein